MANKDGGPAFPLDENTALMTMESATGMSLRDYFAAKAMQGIIASGDDYDFEGLRPIDELSRHAYAMADAMLAERAK